MTEIIELAGDLLYGRLLIALLIAAGVYFTVRTRAVQLRLFPESLRVSFEKPEGEGVSSFGALMVSTAARVGTGNIVGVSTALCLGGCGSVLWMWLIAMLGGATAFVEATLAQLHKQPDGRGGFVGGPAWYIEAALGSRLPAAVFCLCLILTYGVGFNMLTSYNLQSAFSEYGFYAPEKTPLLIGGALAAVSLWCLLGGGRRTVRISEVLVPIMGLMYVLVSLIVVARHLPLLGPVLARIFEQALDFRAIFAGFSGSCMMYGIRRGLFSNEAGIGSAPNAAAAADVSHPAKQGLAQMLSVFIDTLICTATAFMCLCSGTAPSPELSGMPYVMLALTKNFGPAGAYFGSGAMLLFAFTTVIGNFFYIDNCLFYLLGHAPGRAAAKLVRILGAAAVFVGAGLSASAVWGTADILMGVMCLLNLPALLILSRPAADCLSDYIRNVRDVRTDDGKTAHSGRKSRKQV